MLPFTSDAAQRAGQLRAKLERGGVALSLADSQIAGHALALGLTLITTGAAFRRVPHLAIKDWSKGA